MSSGKPGRDFQRPRSTCLYRLVGAARVQPVLELHAMMPKRRMRRPKKTLETSVVSVLERVVCSRSYFFALVPKAAS